MKHIHMHLWVHINTHVHMLTQVYENTDAHTGAWNLYMHTQVHGIFTCTHRCMETHTHMHTQVQ